jgi:hypothetical protein
MVSSVFFADHAFFKASDYKIPAKRGRKFAGFGAQHPIIIIWIMGS